MKKLIVLVVAVAVLGIGWWALTSQSKRPASSDVVSANADVQLKVAPVAESSGGAATVGGQGAVSTVRDSAPLRKPLDLNDPLQSPQSTEELAWLIKNGYPSAEQQAYGAANRATAADLNKALPATAEKIIQAEHMAMTSPQDRALALDYLNDAAIEGSTYALQALAAANGDAGTRDRVREQAYYQAAAMRGEWNEALRGSGSSLSPEQQVMASLMAQQVIANLARQRAARGLPPLPVEVRPGLEDFINRLDQEMSKKP